MNNYNHTTLFTVYKYALVLFITGLFIANSFFFIPNQSLYYLFYLVIILGIASLLIDPPTIKSDKSDETPRNHRPYIILLVFVIHFLMLIKFLDLNIGWWFTLAWIFSGALLTLFLLNFSIISTKVSKFDIVNNRARLVFAFIIIGLFVFSVFLIKNRLLISIISTFFLFLLPGYFWSYALFEAYTISFIERIGISFIFSLVGIPVIFIFLSLAHIPITQVSITFITVCIIISGYWYSQKAIMKGDHAS